jgi:methanethiol oxidase
MELWRPDPTFYPSPKLAAEAPPEKLAYVALLNPTHQRRPDAIGVVDVDPSSTSYAKTVGTVEMPNAGDELHHFGWNACSSCLCPYAPHPHIERRYLVVPGIRSSRVHIIDTKPDPRRPKIVKVIEPERLRRARATAAPIRSIAAPRAYLSARSVLRAATGPAVFLFSIRKVSKSLENGKSIAGRSSCTTISGGTLDMTR